ncbi:MAG TPA: AAC(3) family N-acetyltransferase, partial [Spirochaetota bacterium]|nr:AAC(3) family N-acetyltransferase [Spirochaetota bacterium]
CSFAAWGKHKKYILKDKHLDFQMNEKSPLGRIYEKNGFVLLLGVGYDKNTSFHLAEYKALYPKIVVTEYSPVKIRGKRELKHYKDILYKSEDFNRIGKDFENEFNVSMGFIGSAEAKLFSQRELVDFSVKWMEKNRN